MKTKVEYVSVINPTTKEIKAVKIINNDGELKYHMFLKMYDDGVVVKDDFSWQILSDMAHAYARISDGEKLRFRREEARRIKQEKLQPRVDKEESDSSHRQMLDDLKLEQSELH